MRAAMVMALCWRGSALLLLLLLSLLGPCSMPLPASASTLPSEGLRQQSLHFTSGHLWHRSLLQTVPPPTNATTPPPPANATTPPPPTNATTAPPPTNATTAPPPTNATVSPPARAPPAPPTPARSYLLWVGIGAAILVFASVAIFCLCRKFGQNKIRGAQRLPPLPRYH